MGNTVSLELLDKSIKISVISRSKRDCKYNNKGDCFTYNSISDKFKFINNYAKCIDIITNNKYIEVLRSFSLNNFYINYDNSVDFEYSLLTFQYSIQNITVLLNSLKNYLSDIIYICFCPNNDEDYNNFMDLTNILLEYSIVYEVIKTDHITCMIRGIEFTLKYFLKPIIFNYSDNNESFIVNSWKCLDVNVNTEIPTECEAHLIGNKWKPYILVDTMWNTSYYHVNCCYNYEMIGKSLIGESSFWNLLNILCPEILSINDINYAISVGDIRNCDILVNDIYGTSYKSINLHKDKIASCMGKLQSYEINSSLVNIPLPKYHLDNSISKFYYRNYNSSKSLKDQFNVYKTYEAKYYKSNDLSDNNTEIESLKFNIYQEDITKSLLAMIGHSIIYKAFIHAELTNVSIIIVSGFNIMIPSLFLVMQNSVYKWSNKKIKIYFVEDPHLLVSVGSIFNFIAL
ncbi:uncharacterized protein CMU_024180 [Cryptosporidium muris RN66]|uniref:Pantothenate kinase n=1 Tax=Cryptosporidium muris (strain RN66) TaxID=441375 RepID=B6AC60_CRYMR|nr:uncharacterized protein CMU_024180 [Cryptosporidium muris RN66]EEA05413.1 hypothetical protein, conserved [Cryptosporidium muris RN66]|eukprot:XP_002139762.1 hypothetical protein [Cryptosporidium muris RN66]